jgi:hypothetical protein
LKSEAVLRFARALAARGIESLEDISRWEEHAGIEDEIRAIPGQASGRSLAYFRMLTGEENRIKPDRMIHRFVSGTIGRNTTDEETLNLIRSAAEQLRETYPAISARWLDNLIWSYQREQLGSAREE